MSSRSRKSSRGGKKCVTQRTNQAMWTKIVKQVKKGSKGGPANSWSGHKAQLATSLYKSRGGKYKGSKCTNNSLTKWSREKWGYVKGSNPKKHRGRYLPEKVRKMLTPRERSIENRRKGSRRGVHVKYSPSVNRKMRKAKIY